MKEETAYFLQKAEASLAAARRDLGASDPDAAVSRAYYAAFHAASAALCEMGLAARSHSGTHHLFHKHLAESGEVDRVHARTLSALYRLRQDVDYTLKASPSLRQAEEAAEQAAALVEAVRAWARDR